MVCRGTNVLGSKWQSVTGRLKHISVGQAGVWGISPKNEVNNTRLDPGNKLRSSVFRSCSEMEHLICQERLRAQDGPRCQWMIDTKMILIFSHVQVDGMMKSISSCDGQVWAVSEDGGLYYRANVSLGTPMGSNWFRLEEGHELGWRLVASRDGVMWALDGKEGLLVRCNVSQDNIEGKSSHNHNAHIFGKIF